MNEGLMPLRYAARKYKLPADWLEDEARNGGLSCLIANSQILFDEKILVRELAEKAKQPNRNTGPKLSRKVLG
jgi:hypothetical protein